MKQKIHKHGDVVDLTKCRKGSKPYSKVIDYCPKCGKKGEVTVFPEDMGGGKSFTHKKTLNARVIAFWSVTDSCFVK